MDDQWIISPYDPAWAAQFDSIADKLRVSLGGLAVRIDHVGSTSVPGLDAKPIIDIQISVRQLDPVEHYQVQVESLGFVYRGDNEDRTKRYFRERPGTRRTHLHVRQAGSFSEQLTLLFRDYLRQHPAACMRYAQEKHRLFALYQQQRSQYVEGKAPVVWELLQKAHLWSMETGWSPGSSDR